MSDLTFKPGAILVEDCTVLPASMSLQPSAFSQNWRSVANLDHGGLEAQIEKSGWTFFFMAGEVRKHAFGRGEEKRVRTAVGRVVKDVQAQNCNCVEITGLTTKSFFVVPYVSITAHARHIQEGSQFRAH